MPSPSVVFFGYGDLGLAGLDALASVGARLVAVVVPSNRRGEGIDLMRNAAANRHLQLLVQPPRLEIAPFVEALRLTSPAVVVVWSYSMVLPASVLAVPIHGTINVHGGPLPEYRGGHVAQWAIINGAREFGVALHYMDESVDTGPVIAERRFALDETDDAGTLRQKMAVTGSELLTRWCPRLADSTAPRVPQDPSRARYWPLRSPEEGRIAWTMSAAAICRHVRALCLNTPGAYIETAGRRLAIRRAVPLRRFVDAAPLGEVVAVEASGVRVSAVGGDVLIIAAEDVDGRPIAVADLAELLSHSSTNATYVSEHAGGERVRLVPLDRRHLARTRTWANDPDLMRLMDRARVVSEAEHHAWFEALARHDDRAYFAIETAGEALHVGNVWLSAIDRRHRKAELRVVIGDATARGRGIGIAAIDRMCRHAFDELNLHRIYAYVLAINPAALRAFERAGFAIEGTLRGDRWTGDAFVDTYLMARVSG